MAVEAVSHEILAHAGTYFLLTSVDGFALGMDVFASQCDGTYASHTLLPGMGWVVGIDQRKNTVTISSDPFSRVPMTGWGAARFLFPGFAAWAGLPHPPSHTPDPWAHVVSEPQPAVARCECGVDKTGVGGIHSSYCPKASP